MSTQYKSAEEAFAKSGVTTAEALRTLTADSDDVMVMTEAPVSIGAPVFTECPSQRITYMENAKGHLIPIDKVKPVDKLRDEVVKDMIAIAIDVRATMQVAKRKLFDSFNDFVALSAQEYDVQMGGKKGNTTLLSYDGKYKVQLAVSENIVFDERLQVAKTLIDECLTDWTQDSNDNIKALINQAFQVDKEGNISTGRVLALRSLDINDSKWDRAMDAISDAIQVTDTKEYIRFYERDDDGAYHQISLDFSNV
ncbi:DUF3164 family protein [Psychrobacter sp. T6-1]|uniref:DUF3164 family protein n=1 Tax=Psychrobacter sp. T6-1 TaxID=3457447 RepID=UPI003FCFE459